MSRKKETGIILSFAHIANLDIELDKGTASGTRWSAQIQKGDDLFLPRPLETVAKWMNYPRV